MGAGASKYPDWYPGEPDPALYSFGGYHCGREWTSSDAATAAPGDVHRIDNGCSGLAAPLRPKVECKIELLPVVELTDWEFIASGTFCSVSSCKYKGFSVVAKRVKEVACSNERVDALKALWNEYECLRDLRHPNIIDVYGMCRVKRRDEEKPWGELDVCLVVEQLALGTLGHLLDTTFTAKKISNAVGRAKKMKMIPMRRRVDRMLELALALEYLHGGSGLGTMMHRDLKSANVGFARDGRLKLIDFGLSKMVAGLHAEETETYEMTGGVGSYRYMAPELVKQEPYNTKADIYSWAILSWEILAVSRPYADIYESTFMKKVVFDGERPPLKKTWSERLRSLLASAWDPDLHKRPSASKIVATLRIIRCELAQGDKARTGSRARASSEERRILGCEHSPATRLAMSAPATMSYDEREGSNRDSFPARTTPTSPVRKRSLFTRRRNSSARRRSSLFRKKPAEPPAEVDAEEASADDFASLEGMTQPSRVRLERRDPVAGRAMSMTCTMMRDGSVLVVGQRGERSFIRPRSFSRLASDIWENADEDGDYDEDGPRVEYPVNALGRVAGPAHDHMNHRDKLVAMFSQEREGVEAEPLSRDSIEKEDHAVGVSTDAAADEAALGIQDGGLLKPWPQPVRSKEDDSAAVGDQMHQVRPAGGEGTAGDASASRVTQNDAPVRDLVGISKPALDEILGTGLSSKLERENERSLDAPDLGHLLGVAARPLTNHRIPPNILRAGED